jgi:hypothetical protein
MSKIMRGLSVVLVVFGMVSPSSGQQATGSRRIKPHPTKTIAEQLLASDVEVILESGYEAPHTVGPPPGKDNLQWFTEGSKLVIHVRLADVKSALRSDGRAVSSEIRFYVLDVLKPSAVRAVAPGDVVPWRTSAGTVVVAGKTVRAEIPWQRRLTVGAEYVIFANVQPPGEASYNPFAFGGLIIDASGIFEGIGGRLQSLVADRQVSGITDERLDDVKRMIRSWSGKNR